MTITTTVTWADLLDSVTSELDDLRDAYEELKDLATDEYGDDALDRTIPNDPDLLDDDERDLWVYRTQMEQYDNAAKSIQQRAHILKQLRDEFGDGDFQIRMLSGEETVEIETELRMLANDRDTSLDVVQSKRNTLTVDAATVNAPEGVPRDDGDVKPSKAPNALTLALWEQVNRFNNSGATDFQASGFGESDPAPSPTAGRSATPTTTGASSKSSASGDE
jgi:hypothetical protein